MEKLFENTPNFGYYHQQCTKFDDLNIFDHQYQNFMKLSKVKLWYGSTKIDDNDESINGKFILGIQCDYHNPINGEKKETEMHCGSLKSNDIEILSLELNEGDYINKLYLCYNEVISYIKFESKKGKVLELGQYDKDCEKTIDFNTDKYSHMIHSFHGYFNKYGLRALGCVHLKRRNYFFLNLIDVFRFRHLLKIDITEREKWTEEKIAKLGYEEKAFIRLCLLPDSQFSCVIKFCC